MRSLGRFYCVDRELLFVPIGVGKIEGYQVQSITELAMPSLDFIAYAFVLEDKQPLLQRYVDHEIGLGLLTGALQ